MSLPSALVAPQLANAQANKAGGFPTSAISSAVLIVATGMGLVACGGGGSSAPAPTPVMFSGQAVKGPVMGGQVCAYTLSAPRQKIACATTDANAKYSLALPAGIGEVLLEVTGGSYIDEATGSKVALTTALRTLSKAGSADNSLITPFTELAVQLASVNSPGGKLSLVGFQSQIVQLETGLGITGLASGNPFGGKSTSDATYLQALTAFSKLQAGQGKDVGGALQIMGSQLDKCGVSGLGVSLAVYGALGPTTTSSSGGVMMKAAQSINSTQLSIVSDTANFDVILPSPCTSGVSIDGGALQLLSVLNTSTTPAAWLTAKSVEITQCTGSPQGNWNFPAAKVLVHAESLTFIGDVTITNLGAYQLDPAVGAINLNSSGISLNTGTGCLQIAAINKGNNPFDLSIVGSSASPGAIGLPGGSVSVGAGGIIIAGGTAGSSGGSISSGGSGLTTTGGTSGSGGGGLILVGGKSGS